MASTEHELITGVWAQSLQCGPAAKSVEGVFVPEAESLLSIFTQKRSKS